MTAPPPPAPVRRQLLGRRWHRLTAMMRPRQGQGVQVPPSAPASTAPAGGTGPASPAPAPSENPAGAQQNGGPTQRFTGACPICGPDALFVAHDLWFRDHLLCTRCHSLPRERALMAAIDTYAPSWRDHRIHESSPAPRGTSVRLANECAGYEPSQFWDDVPPGARRHGVQCQDLERLTFEDGSFDLHITQDVMEHVLDPAVAFQEIARTLRPGGMHIFTAPLVNKAAPTVVRAERGPGGVVHHQPPAYHGNPVGDGRSLVTRDWGYDICAFIQEHSGMDAHLVHIDDLSRGIRAQYNEVIVSVKPA